MATSDPFYQEIKLEVDAVLAELGTQYTVRTPGVYDPVELETSVGSTRLVTGLVGDQMVFELSASLGLNRSERWDAKKTLILSADALPAEKEEVLVNGQWFPLSKVTPIKPADITVVYLLDVSR